MFKIIYRYSNFCLVLVIFIGNTLFSFSQESWETFVVNKDKGIMSIAVDMELSYGKPNYKNLLIVGTNTNKCLKNGYPTNEGLEELYVFSDSIATTLDKLTKSKLAGILTYQCAGFDVFYVKDTLNLRESLDTLYSKEFRNRKNYLFIDHDKQWNYYNNTLYPKDISEDFFINHELLNQMVFEGDRLSEPRKIRHWFYFDTERRKEKFIEKIKNLNFAIDSVNYKKDKKFTYDSFGFAREKPFPFEVQISRKDSINPASISKLTDMLQNFSRFFSGKYDGWGADTILEKQMSDDKK